MNGRKNSTQKKRASKYRDRKFAELSEVFSAKAKTPLTDGGSIVTTYHAMGSAKPNLKRKASDIAANGTATTTTNAAAAVAQSRVQDPDLDGFGDSSELGLIDMSGVLDGGDSDDDPSDLDYSTEDEDEQEDEESDAEDDIASEDIPTDDEAGEDKSALANGNNANGYYDEDDKPNYTIEKGADGGIRYVYDEIDPVYDSDDTDANGPINTVRHASQHACSLFEPVHDRQRFLCEGLEDMWHTKTVCEWIMVANTTFQDRRHSAHFLRLLPPYRLRHQRQEDPPSCYR